MTAGEALYEAVLAAPADDLPRLVYADWLEEHGDAERAEFIRAQIAGDHGRAIQLLDTNRAKWSIPRIRGGQTFVRGFVDEVWATAEDVVAHADALLRYPLRGLRITAATDFIGPLTGLPILARITNLDLSNNTGIQNRFDRLFFKGATPNLTSLILRNIRIWGDDLLRWPMIPGFPKLTQLDLSGNPIGDNGLGVLAEHPGFASLRSLTLRGDGQEIYDLIGDVGLSHMARSANAGRLVRLDLSDNVIGAGGIEVLATSDRFTELKHLNLSENSIGPADMTLFARWAQLATVDAVDLRRCNLTGDATAQLLASPWADKFILDEPIA